MNIARILLILIGCQFYSVAESQINIDYSNKILGVWVELESIKTEEIEATHSTLYRQYEFLISDSLYFSTNHIERGIKSIYTLDGNNIEIFGITYSILEPEPDQLELKADLEWAPTLILVRKEKYDLFWRKNSMRLNSLKLNPVFKGEFHLFEYIFSKFKTPEMYKKALLNSYKNSYKNSNIYIKILAVIDTIGNVNVLKVTGIPDLNDKEHKRIENKIVATSGLWSAAKVSGMKIMDTISLTLVNRANSFYKIRSQAIKYFEKAQDLFLYDDYITAIYYINLAINLDNHRYQYYFLRSACNIKLNEFDKSCQDLRMAVSLNPFLSLTYTVLLNDQNLEINCE